jgi:hypothetical protein
MRSSPVPCVAAFVALFFFASPALANAGTPMLALAWPAYWIALLPMIVVQALILRRLLKINWPRALKVTTFGTLWSTFLGVPMVWFMLLAVELLVGVVMGALHASRSWDYILFPLMAAWLGPTQNAWVVYAAFAVLAVPFCAVAILIEGRVAAVMLVELPTNQVRAAIWRATMWSYVLVVACALVYPLFMGSGTATKSSFNPNMVDRALMSQAASRFFGRYKQEPGVAVRVVRLGSALNLGAAHSDA